MSFKKFGIILFLIFSLLPIGKILAQFQNTGFIPANIWYSKDPFEENDKIRIYTFIFNPDSRELSGTVVFFDKTVMLGKKDFTIPPKEANDLFINWTVTAGDHQIFAKIENAKFLISKGNYEKVYLAENETERSSRTVSKKIISTSNNSNTGASFDSLSVSGIGKLIADKTPGIIAQPVSFATNKIEQFRTGTNSFFQDKKDQTKNEITQFDKKDTSKNDKTPVNPILKPFKYIELFFFSVLAFIFDNQLIFYSIFVILVFFILRYIWNIFF